MRVLRTDFGEEGAALQARLDAEQLGQKLRAPETAVEANGTSKEGAACPHCAAPVERGAKFCAACGKPLAVATTCGKCGTKFASAGKFCPECGEPRK